MMWDYGMAAVRVLQKVQLAVLLRAFCREVGGIRVKVEHPIYLKGSGGWEEAMEVDEVIHVAVWPGVEPGESQSFQGG